MPPVPSVVPSVRCRSTPSRSTRDRAASGVPRTTTSVAPLSARNVANAPFETVRAETTRAAVSNRSCRRTTSRSSRRSTTDVPARDRTVAGAGRSPTSPLEATRSSRTRSVRARPPRCQASGSTSRTTDPARTRNGLHGASGAAWSTGGDASRSVLARVVASAHVRRHSRSRASCHLPTSSWRDSASIPGNLRWRAATSRACRASPMCTSRPGSTSCARRTPRSACRTCVRAAAAGSSSPRRSDRPRSPTSGRFGDVRTVTHSCNVGARVTVAPILHVPLSGSSHSKTVEAMRSLRPPRPVARDDPRGKGPPTARTPRVHGHRPVDGP